ncbi:hypothetical protein B0H99_101372 [Planomicrobium soli]|uniref:Phage-related protein n=1 Tax=Planomicrobium soli TaxID=1176648 RepID=A0A2P8H7G1_9BACL|nr:hypothetical protein [Planomicrobium soli]PSL42124.1 hypothetical protein B0H99_101372 [Planomicrobium soli]
MEIIELFHLFGTIDLKDEASKGLDQVDGKAEKTGSMFGKMGKVVAIGAAAVGASAVGAGAALFTMAGKAGDHADRILDLNAITGMSTTSIQEWNQVAKVAGVDTETMTKASSKLTKQMNILETGTGKGSEALKGLGVTYDQLNAASPEYRMTMLTEALAGIEDPAERARLGTDLFGGAWQDLAPIVALGADGMADAKNQAHELGAVMSEDALNDANNFRIGMENLKTMMSAFAMNIGAAVAPVLTNVLLPAFERMIPVIADFGRKIVEWILKVVDSLGDMAAKVQEWAATNQEKIDAVKEGFVSAFEAIGEGIRKAGEMLASMTQWVIEHWNILGPILAGIAAGAIAYQVITGAMAAYRAIMLMVTTAQVAMNLAMLANPIGLVVVAIGLLVAAGILLYKNWDTVKAKLDQLFQKFGVNTEGIKRVVLAGFTFIKNTMQNYMQMAVTVITSILRFIQSTFQNTLAFLKGLVTGDFGAMRSAIASQMQASSQLISQIWSAIKTFLTSTFGRIVSTARSKFQELVSSVREKMNSARDTVKQTIDGIMSFLRGINLATIGRQMIQGLINGIKGMAGNLLSTVKSLVNDNIPAPIKKLLKIASPSKLMHQFGEWTGEGLENGMEDSTTGINKAAHSMAQAAIPELDLYPNKAASMSLVKGINRKPDAATVPIREQNFPPIVVQLPLNGRIIAEETIDINQQLFGAAAVNSAFLRGVR